MRLYFASDKPVVVTTNFSVSFCTELEKIKPSSVNFDGFFFGFLIMFFTVNKVGCVYFCLSIFPILEKKNTLWNVILCCLCFLSIHFYNWQVQLLFFDIFCIKSGLEIFLVIKSIFSFSVCPQKLSAQQMGKSLSISFINVLFIMLLLLYKK